MRRPILPFLALIAVGVAACDTLFTSPPDDADVFDAPIEGLTDEEMAVFLRGDEGFEQAFSPATGLGPIFNDVACAACHSGDGRGRTSNALTRFSRGSDPALDIGGPQLQDRAIAGAVAEELPPGVDVSVRLPPPVFGMGLIEAIPVTAILANADPFDADGDGISGRPNFVTPAAFVPMSEVGGGSGPQLGRFSRKAQVTSVLQQSVEAYSQDMGLTSDFLPVENINPQAGAATIARDFVADPEVPASTVRAVVDYVRMLAPPAPGEDTPSRITGSNLFDQIGCQKCHVRAFTTGDSRISALANTAVVLYSDLLLHDMGDALADGRPDGLADGREWRTTPLWGLRLVPEFLNGDVFLMHDGRAGSVEEAILLHGGEAAQIRMAFEALSADERAALIDFVESR
ncbi:MAG: di-heme oxidoredictase family protein [Gemmatimonadales bacterium]